MNYISAESISKTYQDTFLFKDLSFGLSRGQKVALIGINGSGKSTLLKILAGKESPDSGKVAINKEITIGYLEQDPDFGSKTTISEVLFSNDNPALQAVARYESAVNNPANPKELQLAMEEMDTLKAWDFESKVKEVISKVGLMDLKASLKILSGGQRKRVALAQLLINEPDLLILDEPTNHLDLDTIEWLEAYLSTRNTTLLMVTHDRYFLESITNQIIELDHGNLYSYQGNYSYFLEKKAEREAIAASETEKAKNLMRKELDWVRRQPKARGTKAKYRLDAFEDLKEKASVSHSEKKLELQVKSTRQGNKVIDIEHISKSFGQKKLINDFTYIFRKNEKIGIVGKNGTGKSTFLNMLTGSLFPDSGKISVGETTKFGYYKQEGLTFSEEQRVIDVVKDVAEVIHLDDGTVVTASKFLDFFGFPPTVQYSFVSKLSGGEKKRLQLLKVLMANPNFLILDEPSNDLDIVTLNVLEEFLENFGGCLLIVSHDRYFLDRLADHLFIFEGEGNIRDFNGNYSDYRSWLAEKTDEEKKVKETHPVITTAKPSTESKKLTFKEKKEFEDLEMEIAKLEQKKNEILNKLNSGEGSHEDFSSWSTEIGNLSDLIDRKTFRWLELSEKA